jgi:uncharacterized membrane protein YphA (DoxX/SURF4 family)
VFCDGGRYSGNGSWIGSKGRRCTLHRLFSTFPGGSQAVGLLLLRAAVGVLAIVRGVAALSVARPDMAYAFILAALAITSGLALLAGFLTPIASGLTGLGAIGVALSWFSLPPPGHWESVLTTSLVVVVAVAVILLGPGALSFDARLFGRREIIIPRFPRSPKS